MFSGDALVSHSVLSLCNDEGMLVFATEDEKELDRMVSQCLLSARTPSLSSTIRESGGPLSRQKIEA